jgi:hypothetical protein
MFGEVEIKRPATLLGASPYPLLVWPGRFRRLRSRSLPHATYCLPPVLNPSCSHCLYLSPNEPPATSISVRLACLPPQLISWHLESPRPRQRCPSPDRQSICKTYRANPVCKLGKYFSDRGLDKRGRGGHASSPTHICLYIVRISPFAGRTASIVPPVLCLHTCFPYLQTRGIVL